VRLVLHTAAYWLMLTVRAMLFQTPAGTGGIRLLRARLLKIARITESATRELVAFAAACPEANQSAASLAACNPQDRDRQVVCPE
jgi:Transposase DDE domain group 1